LKNAELIEVLTPGTFDSHKDVLDAFFDVYKHVSQDYVNQEGLKGKFKDEVRRQAEQNLMEKYGIKID